MDIGTFMYWRWFGDADLPMSYAMASWMGILDRHKLEYDAEVLDSIGVLRSAFQPLACYQHRMCGLMGEFASRWPSFRDVPFLLNMGDGACANIGSGCVGAGKMALTVGTSGAIRTLLDGDPETIPQGLWAYKVGTKRALLGASFTDGGNVFAWCTDTLRLPEGNGIESALAASTPDGHGLTVLPFFSGERSPGWVASARATLHGLNIATTPVEITQALLEAVAFRFSAAYSVIEPHLGASHQIIASGGAITSSPYWLQTMANVLQRRIDTVTEQELTSRGTAILALNAIGAWDRLDDVPPTMGRSYIPNTETASVYREAMQRQQRLYGLLIRDGEAMI
jgi:gluconokinase